MQLGFGGMGGPVQHADGRIDIPLQAADPLALWKHWEPDQRSLLEHLRDTLPWEQHEVQMPVGKIPMPRLECWFGPRKGVAYVYSGERYDSQDIHDHPALVTVRDRVNAHTGIAFDALFVNYYRTGADSIGWHADDEEDALGPAADIQIASLSLGVRRRFVLKRKTDLEPEPKNLERHALWLGEGDLLLMGRRVQSEYLHSAPKDPRDYVQRINLTFRKLA